MIVSPIERGMVEIILPSFNYVKYVQCPLLYATTDCLYFLFEELATPPLSAARWEDCLLAAVPPPLASVVSSPSPAVAPPAPTTPTPSCPATPPAQTRIPAATPSVREEGSVGEYQNYSLTVVVITHYPVPTYHHQPTTHQSRKTSL